MLIRPVHPGCEGPDKMTDQISITVNTTTLTLDRKAEVCVVYMGTVGEAENVHTAPFGVEFAGLEWLMLEPGGSLVNAGLFGDHVAKPHPAFKRLLDAGAFTIYATAEEALKAPTAHVTAMIRNTRHAKTLREWLRVEEAREPKRKVIIEGLRERLRINADHSTPVAPLANIMALKPGEAESKRKKAS
jgi:hypothetical protein